MVLFDIFLHSPNETGAVLCKLVPGRYVWTLTPPGPTGRSRESVASTRTWLFSLIVIALLVMSAALEVHGSIPGAITVQSLGLPRP